MKNSTDHMLEIVGVLETESFELDLACTLLAEVVESYIDNEKGAELLPRNREKISKLLDICMSMMRDCERELTRAFEASREQAVA